MKRVIDAPGAAPSVFPALDMSAFLDYIRTVWLEGRAVRPQWWTAQREVDLVAGFFTMLNNDERRMKSGIGFGHFIYEAQDVTINPKTNMPKVTGRTDIQFAHSSEWGPMVTLEFKRLNNRASLRREYFVSGVARFVSGKYANNHDTGYMVGLVTGCVALEKVGMLTYLKKPKAASPLLLQAMNFPEYGDPSLDTPSVEFDTRHTRAAGCLCPTIRVGHILLER